MTDFVLRRTTHTFATVGDAGAQVLAVMTPEVDALVQVLPTAADDEQRAALWARHHCEVVGP